MEEYQEQLLALLGEVLTEENEIEDGVIVIPEREMRIRAQVGEVNEGENGASAVLYFWVEAPLLDEPFFDVATGLATTGEEAVQRAVSNFMLSAMCGLRHYSDEEYTHEVTTTFGGAQRAWQVVESCGFLMGQMPEDGPGELGSFWEVLCDELPKRLGGRRVYWIKAYGAKQMDGSVIGEIRINDVVDPELSKLAAEWVEQWDTQGFLSQKQFFFLVQDEDCYIPYPYTKAEIAQHTRTAVQLLENCETEEDYDSYVDRLSDMLGDEFLAVELHSFMPELCAENHFDQVGYSDCISVIKGEEQKSYFKVQFTPYYWVRDALFDGLSNGTFQKGTYGQLIGMSSIYSVIQQVQEKHGEDVDLSGVKISVGMHVPQDYQVR